MGIKLEVSTDLLRGKLDKRVSQAVSGAMVEQVQRARYLAPVKTGNLKSSWVSNFQTKEGYIKNGAKYAAYQEFGTRFQRGKEMIGWRSGTTAKEIAANTEKRF